MEKNQQQSVVADKMKDNELWKRPTLSLIGGATQDTKAGTMTGSDTDTMS